MVGIAGASAVLVGITGLVLAPFTMGASLMLAGGAALGGAGTVTGAAITGIKSNSNKRQQMTELRQGIEAELKTFQDNINPMAEKMKDLHERTEKIMKDLKEVKQDFHGLSVYFDSDRLKDIGELRAHMSDTMRLISAIAVIFGDISLLFDMILVFENTRALDEMDKLAERRLDEEIDESKIQTKAGKFIVGIRKAIQQLQNIIDEVKKTKDQIEDIYTSA